MRRQTSWALVLVLALAACAPAVQGPRADGTTRIRNSTNASARIRSLFLDRDPESAYLEGRVLVRRFPESPELRAWWIAATDAAGTRDDALVEAARLEATYPGNRWTHFARAWLLAHDPVTAAQALGEARLARRGAEWQPDMLWINAVALYAQPERGRDIALIDSAAARGVVTGELLVRKGYGQESLAWVRAGDSLAFRTACATAADALRLDSANVNARSLAADCVDLQGRDSAALPLYRRVLDFAPWSTGAHRDYWASLRAQHWLSPEDQRARILADARDLVAARPDYPGVLLAVVGAYQDLGPPGARDSIEAVLLGRFPESVQAERILLDRIRRVWQPGDGPPPSDSTRAEMAANLRAFIARGVHRSETYLGQAYVTLYGLMRTDATVPALELKSVVEGMVLYGHAAPEIINTAPLVLADRGVALDLAERLAREIPERARAQIELARNHSRPEDMARLERSVDADMYEALGWVHAKQGDPARATNELQQAVMRAPTRPGALYHLGQAREAMGQLDSAEAAYAQGFVAERTGSSRRNDEALKRLADARGAPERYLRVVSRFQQDDRARRYDEMLRERLDPGLPFAPFRFANLDGGTFDSRSAVGKVMVVNFWGTWCGPCRREMPDLERLFQRFRSDTAVVIVTVDKDEDPQLARDYVRKEGLTLPVLVDDGYAAAQGLHGAPHTWVIDRNGGIAFTGSGVGGLEFEELSWRVELLKRDKLGTAKRPPDARTTPASRSSR